MSTELSPLRRKGFDSSSPRASKDSLPAPLNHPRHRDTTWLTRRLESSLLLSQADVALLNALRPRCAACGRLVDVFSWTREGKDRTITFRAECHGQVEENRVTFDMLPAVMAAGVQGGEAFAGHLAIGETRKLETPE